MAVLTFSFDTGNVGLTRIVNALCLEYGYQATIGGSPNPQSKSEFARQQIKRIVIEAVHHQEKLAVANTATATITPIVLT